MTRRLLIALACAAMSSQVIAEETEAEKSAARLATLFAAVSTEGGTTAKDGAGAIEASMLSASAVGNAGRHLLDKLGTLTATDAVLVFADDQSFPFSSYIAASRSLRNFQDRFVLLRTLSGVPATQCRDPNAPPGGSRDVAMAALSGFVGAVRQKTEIAPVTVTANSTMLARTVAGIVAAGTAILPDNMPFADGSNSDFAKALTPVETEHACWRAYLATLKEDPKKPQIAIAIANIKTTTEDFTAYSTTLFKIDDKGISPYAQLLAQEALLKKTPSVLRVKVEAAGGTSVLRNNFLTLFGADAMRITGGIVVSYSLLKGGTLTSGVFVCPTRVARLSTIHAGDLAPLTRAGEKDGKAEQVPNCSDV